MVTLIWNLEDNSVPWVKQLREYYESYEVRLWTCFVNERVVVWRPVRFGHYSLLPCLMSRFAIYSQSFFAPLNSVKDNAATILL